MIQTHFIQSQNILGEGPVWHPEQQMLYWVDIEGKAICRCSADGSGYESFSVGEKIGAVVFRQQGGLLAAVQDGFAFIDQETLQLEYIHKIEDDDAASRFNDGKVDRAGRFWAGTMTDEGAHSSLYRLDPDLSLHTMETGITISNGIGWSPDSSKMYYADSLRYVVYVYDFDFQSGEIANRREFIKSTPAFGIPDGLTVDSSGGVWCVFWGGAKVARFDQNGNLDREIQLPVSQPTSCAFGGEDFSTLFITSARTGLSAEVLSQQPFSGDVFSVQLSTPGLPEPKFEG